MFVAKKKILLLCVPEENSAVIIQDAIEVYPVLPTIGYLVFSPSAGDAVLGNLRFAKADDAEFSSQRYSMYWVGYKRKAKRLRVTIIPWAASLVTTTSPPSAWFCFERVKYLCFYGA